MDPDLLDTGTSSPSSDHRRLRHRPLPAEPNGRTLYVDGRLRRVLHPLIIEAARDGKHRWLGTSGDVHQSMAHLVLVAPGDDPAGRGSAVLHGRPSGVAGSGGRQHRLRRVAVGRDDNMGRGPQTVKSIAKNATSRPRTSAFEPGRVDRPPGIPREGVVRHPSMTTTRWLYATLVVASCGVCSARTSRPRIASATTAAMTTRMPRPSPGVSTERRSSSLPSDPSSQTHPTLRCIPPR